ncbi:glycosyltransferase [Amycolatopsis sp. NPDC059657]|uniref:glycosyltransferase n=1 Tax=Amycolatopsis sp. NPDC059657 TaxID=3346899 RepID=UPI00366EBA57
MKVLIYAYGTRGDVQPYLALADAVNKRGHHAVLSAPSRFSGLADRYEVEFAGRDDEIIRMYLEDPEVQYTIAYQGSGEAGYRKRGRQASTRLRETLRARLPAMLEDTALAAVGGADLVVAGFYQWELGQHIAEWLRVPLVMSSLWPNCVPSRYYPGELLPFGTKVAEPLNRLSYLPMRHFQIGRGIVDQWREGTLGLAPRRGRHDRLRTPSGGRVPFIHAFSPLVVPPASDWRGRVTTSGFWHLPAEDSWAPPTELTRFLMDGDKPVFIGFGSLVSRDAGEAGRIIGAAVAETNVRAVVRRDANIDAAKLGDNVLLVDELPYEWLFPRMSAVVHGGGVGMVNDALAAGVAQVPVPHTSEQEAWCVRARELGVATAPIRQRDLSPDALSAALREATDGAMAAEAGRLGRRIRAEDGAATAVRFLESVHREHAAGTGAR